MGQSVSRVPVGDIEASLAQIGEIQAVRVVTGSDGEIQEIHVLALPSKPPKQLVRDIESTLMACFGVPIDHRKISIAQIAGVPDTRPAAVAVASGVQGVRPRIVGINATTRGVQASAAVTLEFDGREFVGTSLGPATRTGRDRQVAAAALDAIAQYAGEALTFALEDVAIVQLGRDRVAVVGISLVTPADEQSLCGSAIVKHDDKDAIVRASLDALNRRLGLTPPA